MSKKLITTCLALFALAAFVLPAVASASPVVTHPTGTKLVPGANGVKIKATNIGNTLLTSTSGTTLVECSTASMTGTLTVNSGTSIEGNIESTSFSGTEAGGKCTGLGGIIVTTNVGNGVPWCLHSTGGDEFQVRGGKCSEVPRSITFAMDSGLGVTCHYERANSIKGTFTTHSTGDAILTVTGAGETGVTDTLFTKEAGDSVLCPADGTLDMAFTLETDTATAEPLYIS